MVMKKIFALFILLACSFAAFAQESKIPQRLELAQIEDGDGNTTCAVFNMPNDGQNHYWLDVGKLGHGDEVIQVVIDPLFNLYIPLGDTLDEAIETLTKLRDYCKETPGTAMEMKGCLRPIFPDSDKLETVTVTARKALSRKLEFSLQREGYIRATYVLKSDLGSLLSNVKFYRKLHPKE